MTTRINLGDRAKDRVTGYEGVVIAKVSYLTGCNQVALKPQGTKPDGGTFDALYFDEPFVEVVATQVVTPVVPRAADTGGPAISIRQG